MSVGDARHALDMVKSDFVSETIAAQTFWLGNFLSIPKSDQESVYLLPAFDEFIISYKDRSASLPSENHTKTVSNNGIFRPVIVVNGQVTGIWKRTIQKDMVTVETDLFKQPNQTTKRLIEQARTRFGRFLEKETRVMLGREEPLKNTI